MVSAKVPVSQMCASFLPEVAMGTFWVTLIFCFEQVHLLGFLVSFGYTEPPVKMKLPMGRDCLTHLCDSCWGGDRGRFGFMEAFV